MDAAEARALANQIAAGHAWPDHKHEFPEVASPGEFALLIQTVLQAPSAERKLEGGRTAFWHDQSATIVIINPADADGGTAFRPDAGWMYFESVP